MGLILTNEHPKPDYRHRHELRDKRWIITAWVVSLVIHGALIFIWKADLEKFAPQPKKALQAEVIFKPVVNTQALNKTRPEKARYFADSDQSALREQKSKSAKIKTPKADRFLAKSNQADPLGLRALKPELSNNKPNTHDHMPELTEGGDTQLNAWAWRHAPFFNRIKTQIGQVWSPNRQIARYDPQGLQLGQKDRVTVLSVTIDAEGRLKTLQIANSSGVTYLDDEAERAFKKAAPFPFPPKELFNSQDGFNFQFAFHLQINKGIKFDFDW